MTRLLVSILLALTPSLACYDGVVLFLKVNSTGPKILKNVLGI